MRLGKTRRLADLRVLDSLPRSHIGDGYQGLPTTV
jgi:hypothetical protein